MKSKIGKKIVWGIVLLALLPYIIIMSIVISIVAFTEFLFNDETYIKTWSETLDNFIIGIQGTV